MPCRLRFLFFQRLPWCRCILHNCILSCIPVLHTACESACSLSAKKKCLPNPASWQSLPLQPPTSPNPAPVHVKLHPAGRHVAKCALRRSPPVSEIPSSRMNKSNACPDVSSIEVWSSPRKLPWHEPMRQVPVPWHRLSRKHSAPPENKAPIY